MRLIGGIKMSNNEGIVNVLLYIELHVRYAKKLVEIKDMITSEEMQLEYHLQQIQNLAEII
jgi:hypothetical protein